jgi:hypothetical protein
MLETLDWEDVITKASEHQVIGLIYWKLYHYGLLDSLPGGIRQRFQDMFYSYQQSSLFYEHQLREIYESCGRLKKRFMVVKGLPLEIMLYPALGIRGSYDMDLVISQKDYDYFNGLVVKMGYNFQKRDAFHSVWHHPKTTGCIELHIKESAFIDMPRTWFHPYKIRHNEIEIPTFSYEDMFIYIIHHIALHHYFWMILMWASDIRLFLANKSHPLDWNYVNKTAKSLSIYHSTWRVLSISGIPYRNASYKEMPKLRKPSSIAYHVFKGVVNNKNLWEGEVPCTRLWRFFLYLFSYDNIVKGIKYSLVSFGAIVFRLFKGR